MFAEMSVTGVYDRQNDIQNISVEVFVSGNVVIDVHPSNLGQMIEGCSFFCMFMIVIDEQYPHMFTCINIIKNMCTILCVPIINVVLLLLF